MPGVLKVKVGGAFVPVLPANVIVAAGQPAGTSEGQLWYDTDEATPQVTPAYPNLVTTLPLNPVNGQECYFDPAPGSNSGVVWRLRYNSASASVYKWECIGGSPLQHTVNPAYGPATSAVYVDTTNGPTITLPNAGDYIFAFGAFGAGSVQSAFVRFGIKIGAAVVDDNFTCVGQPPLANYWFGSLARTYAANVPSPASVCKMQANCNSGTMTVQYRWLTITPVRIA